MDKEVERVMNEIREGRHDDGLLHSPLINHLGVMKIARERAMNTRVSLGDFDVGSVNDFRLQIEAFAEDLAERRSLR